MSEAEQPTPTETATPVDEVSATAHQLKLGDRILDYTATCGRVVVREEEYADDTFKGHAPKLELSFTSYVAAGEDPSRPVTFAFNGGPGSSSVWLHLGLLGPRIVDSGDVGALTPPPYALIDNPESLLAVSDLVFIDPVSSGYSRAVEQGSDAKFHGYTGDIESVGEFIRLWTTRNQRWMSPKYLAGESYGTTRAAALAEFLQSRYGMYLNGVMLISSVLDFRTLIQKDFNDDSYVSYLPTYAATAWYHGKHEGRELADVLAEAEAFAAGRFPWALRQGNRLSDEEYADLVANYASLTGLSADYVRRANLRITHPQFFAELLRDEGQVVGRLDSRFTGAAADGNAQTCDADPSMDAITGPYAAAWNHYVRSELDYASDLHYEQISYRAYQAWSYKEFENTHVDVTDKLARAMRMNPDLRVHVAYGYFDGATPYYGAEHVFAHLKLPPELYARIEHKYYLAGHMMYVHPESRKAQSQDLIDFVAGGQQ